MSAIIYRHGDFERMRPLYLSAKEKQMAAYLAHPIWEVIRSKASDSRGAIQPDWRGKLQEYLLNDLSSERERKLLLAGLLPAAEIKKPTKQLLPKLFNKLKKTNSLGL